MSSRNQNQSLKTARKKKTTNKNNSSNNKKNKVVPVEKNNIQNIKLVNNEQIDKENIYSKLDNDISIITFTRAINNIKKLLIDTNIMLINITLTEALIKNYDILTKYILNSDKSQNTKRTLLNNILMILKSNSNLSFSDYVKYDIARKQIKIS